MLSLRLAAVFVFLGIVLRLSDFDFELSDELIAQQPVARRDRSRMLVVDRSRQSFEDRHFVDLPSLLDERDVLVLNNTKVFPARLQARSETGAAIELFLVRQLDDAVWTALARPGRRLRPGKRLLFENEPLTSVVVEKTSDGMVHVRFDPSENLADVLEQIGRTPLPPYIKREINAPDADDRGRYQTIYASRSGAIAAPTAGLHFTPQVLDQIRANGVAVVEITLHVGYGTFEPVRVDNLSEHRVLPEHYSISDEAAARLESARLDGHRIVAVGTTTTRALETELEMQGKFTPGERITDVTITPGFEFKAAGAMLTNFHLPQSSLLILTSTFGGHELIMKAYRHAVAERYRFYSYGDCMFIV